MTKFLIRHKKGPKFSKYQNNFCLLGSTELGYSSIYPYGQSAQYSPYMSTYMKSDGSGSFYSQTVTVDPDQILIFPQSSSDYQIYSAK